jgi:predicted neutral ceramidase superfamily lipid hydrolase
MTVQHQFMAFRLQMQQSAQINFVVVIVIANACQLALKVSALEPVQEFQSFDITLVQALQIDLLCLLLVAAATVKMMSRCLPIEKKRSLSSMANYRAKSKLLKELATNSMLVVMIPHLSDRVPFNSSWYSISGEKLLPD